jgi:hypothetical protein
MQHDEQQQQQRLLACNHALVDGHQSQFELAKHLHQQILNDIQMMLTLQQQLLQQH